jgi:hypothetical protein
MSKDFFDRRLSGEESVRGAQGMEGRRSRFVKIQKAKDGIHKPKQRAFRDFRSPKFVTGRSFFHVKGVKQPSSMTNLLVSGHSNVKIGKRVLAKKFYGYDIYTLSLEERNTCPRSCLHWENCYGNNMPYAKRVDHTADDFLPRLASELKNLTYWQEQGRSSGRKGVLIRLHALGDFYSVEYVQFWAEALGNHATLAAYGYTARKPDTEIGQALLAVKQQFGDRFMIRWSDGGVDKDCTVSIERPEDKPSDAFQCPEQFPAFTAAGVEIKCDNCGLCWSTTRNVAFLEH